MYSQAISQLDCIFLQFWNFEIEIAITVRKL